MSIRLTGHVTIVAGLTDLTNAIQIVVGVVGYVLLPNRVIVYIQSAGQEVGKALSGIGAQSARDYIQLVLLLGGVGGAIYAQAISGNFSVSTIAGQGFISLAAMIFGKWNPIGAMLSSLLFGLFTSLAVIGGQIPGIKEIPSSFLQMAPYVFTIIILALFLGKAIAPKADGVNYIKSK